MFRATVSALAILGILTTAATADNITAPPWRGMEGTTYQEWRFDTAANPADPEVVVNPNGDPIATIGGQFPGTYWKAEDKGHTGVWRVDVSGIELTIPNFPDANERKEIWLQVTYDGGPASLPELFVLPPASSIELIQTIPLDDFYKHDTYLITIEPNPTEESVFVLPRYCEIYLDQIVVETICVPEPATLSLIGVGAAALIRRRRRG